MNWPGSVPGCALDEARAYLPRSTAARLAFGRSLTQMSYVPPHRRGKASPTYPVKLADIAQQPGPWVAPPGEASGIHFRHAEGAGGGWGNRSGSGGFERSASRQDQDVRSAQDARVAHEVRSAYDTRSAHDARSTQVARSAQDAHSTQDARSRGASGEQEDGWQQQRIRGTRGLGRERPAGGLPGAFGCERGGDWEHGNGSGREPGLSRDRGGHGGGGKPSAPRKFGSVEAERSAGGLKWSAGGNSAAELLRGATCIDDEEGQRMIYCWPAAGGKPPRGIYFQDRRKQYAFACGGAGCGLLAHLASATTPLLRINAALVEAAAAQGGLSCEHLCAEGERLYADKPNLKVTCALYGMPSLPFSRVVSPAVLPTVFIATCLPMYVWQTRGGGTWSDEEYGHLGLQGIYLRLKSVQRFTEAWALCERAALHRVFSPAKLEQGRVRVVSIGGGPGFELLAFDLFWRWLRHAHAQRKHAQAQLQASKEAAAQAAPPAAAASKDRGGPNKASWADRMSEEEDDEHGLPPAPRLRLPAEGLKARPPLDAYDWFELHQPAPRASAVDAIEPQVPAAAAVAAAALVASPPAPCACALELVSADLQPGWQPYVQRLGEVTSQWASGNVNSTYAFVQADLKKLLASGGLRKHVSAALGEDTTTGEPIDFCLISNVLIYCSDEPTVSRRPHARQVHHVHDRAR